MKNRREASQDSLVQSVMNAVNDSIIVIDNDGCIQLANIAACKMLGYRQDELVGMSMERISVDSANDGGFKSFWTSFISRLIEEGSIQNAEKVCRRGNGEHIHVRFSVSLAKRSGDAIQGIVCSAVDITQDKLEAKMLGCCFNHQVVISNLLWLVSKSVPLTNVLAEALDTIIAIPSFVSKSKGIIFLVDETGYNLRIVASKGLDTATLESCAILSFGSCLCGQAALTKEIIFVSSLEDRHTITFEGMKPHGHYCVPILIEDRLLGVLNVYLEDCYVFKKEDEAFLEDVANALAGVIERRQKDELLRIALDQALEAKHVAENANRAKSEFLANMSHELRSPMTSIDFALTEVLEYINGLVDANKEDGENREEVLGLLRDALSSKEDLMKLLGDLLDLSRLESGRMKFDFQLHDFRNIISRSHKERLSQLKQKNLKVAVDIGDVDTEIKVDALKIKQVLIILLDNAAKFTPFGMEIVVSVISDTQLEQDKNSSISNFVFTVSNPGVSIPEDELLAIFDKFTQSSITNTGAGGIGLGLSIAKEIVDAHNGTIQAQNTDKGVVFIVTLPRKQQNK